VIHRVHVIAARPDVSLWRDPPATEVPRRIDRDVGERTSEPLRGRGRSGRLKESREVPVRPLEWLEGVALGALR
jgi:hypothetical protein